MRLPPHRQHRYVSRKGLIDCAFLACDYHLIVSIVTVREKERGNGFHLSETARLIFARTSLNAELL